MPEIKQIERIIRILQRLALRGEVTVRELYEYFEHKVPKRTLQRDLLDLSAAGIPIIDKPGNGREYIWCLDRSYLKFIPATIGSQELLASYFLERLTTITKGTKLEKDARSLLNKSRQLVAPGVFETSDDFDAVQPIFGASFTGYIDYSQHSDKIDKLVEAASTNHVCKFVYKSTLKATQSEFEAEPYMLLCHKGALYGIVYVPAHDNYIFLPVQRIRDIQITAKTFKRDKNFSLDELRKHRFGIFGHESMKPQRVVLRFHKDIAEVVAERIWHPSQKLKRHKDGSLTLELKCIISDELRAWIGSWLEWVEVVEPQNMIDTENG